MNVKRVLMWFMVLVFVVGFVTVGFAEEAKKYPPYPDVWGYDLSLLNRDYVSFHKMLNGDYAMAYPQKKHAGDKIVKFFFAGKEIYLTKEEYRKFEKENKWIPSYKATLEKEECQNSFTDIYFYKTNNKAQFVFIKMAFYLHDKPRTIALANLYKPGERECAGNGEMSMVLENAEGSFVDLDDGGFLLRGYLLSGDFIIRFNKDLKTKSDLINKKVFLIDKDVFDEKFFGKHIGKIKGKATAKNYQALHDDLLKYFMEIKNKEQK